MRRGESSCGVSPGPRPPARPRLPRFAAIFFDKFCMWYKVGIMVVDWYDIACLNFRSRTFIRTEQRIIDGDA